MSNKEYSSWAPAFAVSRLATPSWPLLDTSLRWAKIEYPSCRFSISITD